MSATSSQFRIQNHPAIHFATCRNQSRLWGCRTASTFISQFQLVARLCEHLPPVACAFYSRESFAICARGGPIDGRLNFQRHFNGRESFCALAIHSTFMEMKIYYDSNSEPRRACPPLDTCFLKRELPVQWTFVINNTPFSRRSISSDRGARPPARAVILFIVTLSAWSNEFLQGNDRPWAFMLIAKLSLKRLTFVSPSALFRSLQLQVGMQLFKGHLRDGPVTLCVLK